MSDLAKPVQVRFCPKDDTTFDRNLVFTSRLPVVGERIGDFVVVEVRWREVPVGAFEPWLVAYEPRRPRAERARKR